ncbi:ABC transporter permease [Paenibacillus thiaminolyticus]|uniref:Multidrug transporter permease n=1 Tax=Paenibacillus thiaminolyticus TaxID=49283 RepID=A0A3A3GM29_PANTH|nr:ABC-2 family transporter protein [Paenibacillus thiaminolyticus]RJG26169.1 multidrug transporter permease [Paenibacillus thiaminolyticus]
MIKYLNLFGSFVKINVVKAMTYRANFFLNLLDSVLWFGITLLFFNSIYGYVDEIKGWRIYDIYLLIGTSELIKSVMFTLFINNLPMIPNLVNRSQLDLILIRPVNSQFLISLRNLDFGNFGNIPLAVYLIVYAIINKGEAVSFLDLCSYLGLLLVSIILAYSLWFTIMTLSIWLSKVQGMHELFLGAMTLMRYPSVQYKGVVKFVFTVIFPIVLVSNVPVIALSDVQTYTGLYYFYASTLAYFLFSIFFWRFALRYYQSASS